MDDGHRRRSTAAAARSCPASSTRTRTSCLPAIGATSCAGGWRGATYAEIAAAGGGILSTVRATRAASEEALADATRGAAGRDARGRHDDLRGQERLRPRHRDRAAACCASFARSTPTQPIELVATFMGAHEVPPEYRGRQSDYVRPRHRRHDPARAPDSPNGATSSAIAGSSRRTNRARSSRRARAPGMKPRIHADELARERRAGGGRRGRRAIGRSSRARARPTASPRWRAPASSRRSCPCAAFYLKLGRFAPARDLIAAGVPVALATDVNPGGGFSPSMPFAMTLALLRAWA